MYKTFRALVALSAAATSIAFTPVAHANRVVSQSVIANQTGKSCTHRACATSTWVEVFVPPGADIRAIRTMTTAHYPDDVTYPIEIPAGADVGWSEFGTPEVSYMDTGAARVRVQYWNRSENRARKVQLVVEFDD